ncbi:hypothetical protein [Noviherbaspirillum sp. Root189]|uniref:hypothetical protein n=1 Tax=Noviherbaspirillum sp. Root189 TaxID=1736487 RepID=UPI00070F92EC|nr:hypothetical protein [Noviherbaspirillum sp. Root189]KRB67850.1 hypothetical protein ASE07_09290 [Noviherbaspirillum sp. Root189]
MQRALSYDDGPSLSVPLRFFLTGPLFAVAAAALLFWEGPAALVSRWSMTTLALTHLLTLGFLAMIMSGALLQILPVVAGVNVLAPRYTGAVVFSALAGGTALLVAAFLTVAPLLFRLAGVSLGLGLLWLLGATSPGLFRCNPGGATATVDTIRLALASLLVTVCSGMVLVIGFGWSFSIPLMQITDFHASWGLLGWVGLLLIGVAFQVIPMFQATPVYPHAASFPLAGLLATTLAAWTLTAVFNNELTTQLRSLLGFILLCTLIGFACVTLWLLQQRRRPNTEATTLFWRLSMISLLICGPVYLLALPAKPLLLGILMIIGCAYSAVNGMLYKIVPFLLWYDLQSKTGLDRKAVPSVRDLSPDRAAKQQFWLHLLGLIFLLGAVVAPETLARPAAVIFGVSGLRLCGNLLQACLVYRKAIRKPRINPAIV